MGLRFRPLVPADQRELLRWLHVALRTATCFAVHPLNPAIKLYERCGFVKQGLRNTCHLMVATIAP